MSSLYRCAECGTGERLSAWAEGLFEGPLAEDGTLARHDYAEDTDTLESSIMCTEHGDAVTIHKNVGGQWCVKTFCSHCEHGQIPGRRVAQTCRHCHGSYSSWTPLADQQPHGNASASGVT